MDTKTISFKAPRVIGPNVIDELQTLHDLSGGATSPEEEAGIRDDLLDTLFAVECLPNTAANIAVRVRAVGVLYGGDFTEWEDDSPSGRLVRQILEVLSD